VRELSERFGDTLASVVIRLEHESDYPIVRAVHRAAFGAQGNAIGDLVDDLRGSVAKGQGLSIVAEAPMALSVTSCSRRACSTPQDG
jgi:predicted N-acetyltransferase YhbS